MFTGNDIQQSITYVPAIQKKGATQIYLKEERFLTPPPTTPSRKLSKHASQYSRVNLPFKTKMLPTHASQYSRVYLTFKTKMLPTHASQYSRVYLTFKTNNYPHMPHNIVVFT